MTKTECEMRLLCLGDGMEMRSALEGHGQDRWQPEATRPRALDGVAGSAQPGMSSPSQPRPHRLQRGLWLPALIHEQQS